MDLNEPCSQTDFSMLVGATPQAIQKRVSDGSLPSGRSAGQWLVVYCEQLRTAASGREVTDTRKRLEEAKTREAMANAQTKELELYRQQDLIMDRDQVCSAMEDWIALSRSEFVNSINKIIDMVEGAHGITVEREKLDEITEATTRIIADFSLKSEEDD